MTQPPNWLAYWQRFYQTRLTEKELEQRALPNLEFNAQLTVNAFVDSANAEWVPSPAPGVQRILLERQGGEKTLRATSLVAYAPNSHFKAHTHPLGEEFFVLAGTFSDERGDYPAGTYVRNPSGSQHAPFSRDGCLILVKLQQMQADDNQRVVTQWPTRESGESKLFEDYERVSIVQSRNDPLETALLTDGIEGLVVAGRVTVGQAAFEQGQWFRFAADVSAAVTLEANSVLWLKHGHLRV